MDAILLGHSLVSWSSKKAKFCGLVHRGSGVYSGRCMLCLNPIYEATLLDFGVQLDRVPLLCDNKSVVKLAKNPVQHSHTKHIDIRHHFLRDHEVKGDITLQGVRSEEQLADIFTKPLDESSGDLGSSPASRRLRPPPPVLRC